MRNHVTGTNQDRQINVIVCTIVWTIGERVSSVSQLSSVCCCLPAYASLQRIKITALNDDAYPERCTSLSKFNSSARVRGGYEVVWRLIIQLSTRAGGLDQTHPLPRVWGYLVWCWNDRLLIWIWSMHHLIRGRGEARNDICRCKAEKGLEGSIQIQ